MGVGETPQLQVLPELFLSQMTLEDILKQSEPCSLVSKEDKCAFQGFLE